MAAGKNLRYHRLQADRGVSILLFTSFAFSLFFLSSSLPPPFLSIFSHSFLYVERMIWPQERICDIIAKWDSYKRTVESQGLNSTFHILFKQQLYLNPKEVITDE